MSQPPHAVPLAPRARRLNTAQIGRRYGKSAKTVRRWIQTLKLRAYVTNESSPHAQRYECDEAQLAEFERTHWRLTRTDPVVALAYPEPAELAACGAAAEPAA